MRYPSESSGRQGDHREAQHSSSHRDRGRRRRGRAACRPGPSGAGAADPQPCRPAPRPPLRASRRRDPSRSPDPRRRIGPRGRARRGPPPRVAPRRDPGSRGVGAAHAPGRRPLPGHRPRRPRARELDGGRRRRRSGGCGARPGDRARDARPARRHRHGALDGRHDPRPLLWGLPRRAAGPCGGVGLHGHRGLPPVSAGRRPPRGPLRQSRARPRGSWSLRLAPGQPRRRAPVHPDGLRQQAVGRRGRGHPSPRARPRRGVPLQALDRPLRHRQPRRPRQGHPAGRGAGRLARHPHPGLGRQADRGQPPRRRARGLPGRRTPAHAGASLRGGRGPRQARRAHRATGRGHR